MRLVRQLNRRLFDLVISFPAAFPLLLSMLSPIPCIMRLLLMVPISGGGS
jgi:hypothetical protein